MVLVTPTFLSLNFFSHTGSVLRAGWAALAGPCAFWAFPCWQSDLGIWAWAWFLSVTSYLSSLTRNWPLWERFRIARAVTSSPWCLSLPEHTRLALWAEAQGSSQEKCRRAANLPAARSLQVHAASRSTQPSVLHSQGMWCRERICKVWSLLASPGTALNGMCPALSCGISSNWCVRTPGLMEVFYMNCTGFGVCISSGFANYLSPMESNMLYHIQADILIMYYSLCWRN